MSNFVTMKPRSHVRILIHRTWAVSRRGHAVRVKKCTKKCTARAKLSFCGI